MSKRHDNSTPIIPQARAISMLTNRQAEVYTELVLLLHQSASIKNESLIAAWWLTLPDRLTDDEWLFFRQLECRLFSGGVK